GMDVISLAMRPYHCEAWADSKLLPFRRCATSSVQIMPAAVTPRAYFASPIEILHIYYPHTRLAELATVTPEALELRDPCAGFDPDIATTCRQIVQEMTDRGAMSQLHFDSLALSLGVQLIRRWSNVSNKPERIGGGLAAWQLKRVTEFMSDHLQDDLVLVDLAKLVDLSASHFARAFRQSTGLPPHRWLVKHRLERARELLGQSELDIAEIALLCGFGDQSHFTLTFRKAVGTTPGAYRRETRR
ncbi:MAG: AraC family transcriptional regulator, partial [Rhodocyclaceae bacterium]|nr:AraC family transcriptional regulator [Rhodocyclaceae bacterium]